MRQALPAIALLLLCGSPRATAGVEETANRLWEIGKRLDFLYMNEIVFNGPVFAQMPGDVQTAHAAALADLRATSADFDTLRALTDNPLPRVRTLALSLIFERYGPRGFPLYQARLKDDAPTFAAPPFLHALPSESADRGNWKSQTVAEFARAFTNAYLQEHQGETADQWWSRHRERTWSSCFFAADLRRACHGVMSRTKASDCLGVERVRAAIDRLEPKERALQLLALEEDIGRRALISEEGLIEVAKTLRRADLLALAEGRLPSDDPDLVTGAPPYERARRFVLLRAPHFFTAADAPRLGAVQEPLAQLAAARIRSPIAADQILAAFRSSSPYDSRLRLHLLAGLAEAGRVKDRAAITDAMLEESRRAHGTMMSVLLAEAEHHDHRGMRALIAEIIADTRFVEIPIRTQGRMVDLVNRRLGREVLNANDVYQVNIPGVNVTDWNDGYWEKRTSPEESAIITKQIAVWQEQLATATSQWRLTPDVSRSSAPHK